MIEWIKKIKIWAKNLKQDIYTLWFVARDAETFWGLKLFAFIVVAYAISPIDLIPDFIPILGYVDDIILIPLGIWLLIRYTPEKILSRSRIQAQGMVNKPVSWGAAFMFMLIWGGVIFYIMTQFFPHLHDQIMSIF